MSITSSYKDSNYLIARDIFKFIKEHDYYTDNGVIEHLETYIEENYTFIKDYKPVKSNIWLRLLSPIYFITILLFSLIIQPIKWLVTGNYYFKSNSKVHKKKKKWSSGLTIIGILIFALLVSIYNFLNWYKDYKIDMEEAKSKEEK